MTQHMLHAEAAREAVTTAAQIPTVAIVTITPGAATALLNANTRNRRLSESRIRGHMDTIQHGRWMLSDSALTIDTDGLIVNGAHRLTACERTGLAITILMLEGVPPQTRDIVDTGLKRTMAHTLTIRGEVNATNLGAGIALHYFYSTGGIHLYLGSDGRPTAAPTRGAGAEVLSHDLLLAHLDDHPELRLAAKDAAPVGWHLPRMKRSTVVAFLAITRALDAYQSAAFWERVKTGVELHPGMPENTLRNWLLRADASVSRFYALGMMIKAWNAGRAGEEMRALRLVHTETFPEAK